MTKIGLSQPSYVEYSQVKWTKRHDAEIRGEPTWHGNIQESKAEALLQGKDSFTYLLRSGQNEGSYFISFVKEDGFIKHQFFSLEYDRKGWYYRNGVAGPEEVVSETLYDLIPQMMHCTLAECKML